jgi:uncharacterized protein YcbX
VRVAELWRYPVKGLRGEALARVEIAADGIPGDRGLRVADGRGTVTGRRKQRIVALPATLGDGGEPLVAGEPWGSEAAASAIREVAGEDAALVPADGGHAFDAAPILIVTDGGVAQLRYDRRRFRPNVVIEGVDGAAERNWIRGRLRMGEALLLVSEPCERCVITTIDPDTTEVDLDVLRRARLELGGMMGVYCSVLEPGAVAVGDPVAFVG